MKAWRIAAVLAVLACVSWTMPANSQTMGLYDDFSSGAIDRVRWAGYEYDVGPTENFEFNGENDWGGLLEFRPMNGASARRAVGGQVQISLVTEEGPYGKARNGLRINHPALLDHLPRIRTLQAAVTVVDVSVPASLPGCTRTAFGRAGAHIFGHFGNDNAGDGGLTGDIFASLALVRRVEPARPGVPAGVRNVVEITTGRCNNSDCQDVDFGEPRVLSFAWQPGIPYVLTIAWNPQPAPGGAFTFTAAGGAASESDTVVTNIVERAHAHAFDLRVENHPVTCRNSTDTDWLTGRVSVDARFDDVRINANAAAAAP